ncbi:uncharacterized protein LOC135388765 isoform X1 [Ornithodoros turicata]|uniref:uncharacterized protein LOC135388765 isoform X1 n=1 Tax=Ornithodoros turicata TaxID=34597 RepID=UPI0031390E8D
MKLDSLKKDDLLEICEDLGIDTSKLKRKPHIIEAILSADIDDDEVEETWQMIRDRRERKEREYAQQKELLDIQLKLQVARNEEADKIAETSFPQVMQVESFKMTNFMQPYKLGEDIGMYLVNFERTCERQHFVKSSWPQRLLTLLPGETADVLARMPKDESEDYDKVKSSLLRKYRLSAEAFRQRFRSDVKKPNQPYVDFAYNLKSNLVEWLTEVKAYGDHDKVIQHICIEQFFDRIPEDMRFWIQDKPDVDTIEKASELADDYVSRRVYNSSSMSLKTRKPFTPYRKFATNKPERDIPLATPRESSQKGAQSTTMKEKTANARVFEARKPPVCYFCHEPGHIASVCDKKPKTAFSYVKDDEENLKLLGPYLCDLTVNGTPCKALRDSGATIDVAHPSLVRPEDYTGESTWIRQIVQANSVCLPVAKVTLKGSFGEITTEAAVSKGIPQHYPYLFSNKSANLLAEQGKECSAQQVNALTRSKAREVANKLRYDYHTEQILETEPKVPVPNPNEESSPDVGQNSIQQDLEYAENSAACSFLPPISNSFDSLRGLDKQTLKLEQQSDSTLERLFKLIDGVPRKNATFATKSDLLYRYYNDRKGRTLDQLVVPRKYRQDILHLSHACSWSGHLGIRKTKDRLLQEYYWPGCFKDVENFVRSCDSCQRVGKSTDQWKAPLKLVPIITEPFKRLVIDTVGPLPQTKSGYRYILTLLCPATKFPEAVPLKEITSSEIVDALLGVFARIGFPSEIQSDQASVFTSALTTTFLQRCGITIVHSSVYHPQSNAVERWHSTLKRVLRALCYEHKKYWDMCLPAAMFALRTVPHEATGFSPAELVYGRSLRSPLRIIREQWEDSGDDPTVVDYVLELLNRLHVAQELTLENMKIAQEKAKTYYDRTARSRLFSPGQKVMILRPCRQNKLQVQWEGPAQVIEKLSDTNYVVQLGKRKSSVKIYHANLMKPYTDREAIVNLTLNEPEEIPLDIPSLGTGKVPTVHEIMLNIVEAGDLQPNQIQDLTHLIEEYQTLFSDTPGKTTLACHDIELTSEKPVKSKPYRMAPRQKAILETEIKKMLDLGVIEPGESDYASPLILVEAPGKDPRPCIDYRKLNAITRDQIYPIPNIEERIETVSAAKFISTLDLVRGYWQVPLTERAKRYAAFTSPIGTFRPVMLTFGLKNAPFCFSKLMDTVLKGLENFAVPYLDDVAIFSSTWEDHIQHLKIVFQRFREAGLIMKAKKCKLARSHVTYLGHIVGHGYRSPLQTKVAAIKDFPRPTTKTQVRSFLGLTGYYQRYIRNYADIASPLTDALKNNQPNRILWDTTKESAFQKLKTALCSKPLLRAPDFARPFIIQCDASDRGIGAVLCQRDEAGREHPVVYISRKLTLREQAYCASEKECACIVWAIQKLSCYMYGTRFTVETDHCPLTWLNQMSNKNSRLLRWSIILQQYNFDVRYRKGKENGNADALSRAV